MAEAAVANSRFRLLIDLTKREFKVRYLGSLLGGYWNIIHPLVMIIVFTVIFSKVMRARMGEGSTPYSYSLYLCSGLLAWNLFQEIVAKGSSAIIDNAAFMKKMSFPPLVLFGGTLLSACINFLIAFAIFSLFLFSIKPVGIGLLATFFLIVMLLALFGFGMSIGLGCLNVFLRDVQQLVAVLFQLWFWFTPIIYLTTLLPEFAQKMLYFNPAWPFIESMHQVLYYGVYPELNFWLMMVGWASASLVIGLLIYQKSIGLVRDQL